MGSCSIVYVGIKDPNKSNTHEYFRHSNGKGYELALLRPGYFFYFGRLYVLIYHHTIHGGITFDPVDSCSHVTPFASQFTFDPDKNHASICITWLHQSLTFYWTKSYTPVYSVTAMWYSVRVSVSLGERIVSRDGLPRGVLLSDILRIKKYCPGLKLFVARRTNSLT